MCGIVCTCSTLAVFIVCSSVLSDIEVPLPAWNRSQRLHVVRYPLFRIFAVRQLLSHAIGSLLIVPAPCLSPRGNRTACKGPRTSWNVFWSVENGPTRKQWLKRFCEAGGGAHLTKPGWSKPIGLPIPTPLIWRYLGVQ